MVVVMIGKAYVKSCYPSDMVFLGSWVVQTARYNCFFLLSALLA
jgi:hypothetical protein